MATVDTSATLRLFRKWLAPLLLVLLVLLLFVRSLRYEFIDYGEVTQIISDPSSHELSFSRLTELLTRPIAGRYSPLRTISLALDYKLWGASAWGYHLTSILWHTANVLLLYALTLKLLRRAGAISSAAGKASSTSVAVSRSRDVHPDFREALFTAGAFGSAVLFTVHPVVIESVVWIGARETLIMGFFALLCLHAHIAAVQVERSSARRWAWHLAAGICGLLACLASVLASVLPVIVVLYDLIIARKLKPLRWWMVIAGSLLLWAAAALSILMKLRGDQLAAESNLRPLPEWLPPAIQIYTAFYTFWYNIKTLSFSSRLTLIYPNVIADRLLIKGVLAGIVLFAVLIILIWRARRRPILQFALLWFTATILPASHLVPHSVYRADRFLYLTLAGMSIAIAALAAGLCAYGRRIIPVTVAGLIMVATLAARTWWQTPVWQSTLSVFERCVQINPLEPAVHNNLGAALLRDDQIERANRQFNKALRLQSQGMVSVFAQINLGYAYLRLGEIDKAIESFNQALRINPNEARAYNGRASALVLKREPGHRRALLDLGRAIDLQPDYAEAFFSRGNIYSDLGLYQNAINDYTRLIELNPSYGQAYHMRGVAKAGLRLLPDALADLNTAVSFQLQDPALYLHRGMVETELGSYEEAAADFTAALELRPRYAEAMIKRGIVYYVNLNQPDRAIEDFSRALSLQPGAADAHLNRGLVWINKGDYESAVQDLTQAIRLRADDPRAYFHRGLAYAERREFDRAIRDWRRTVLLAPNSDLARNARQNLSAFVTTRTQPS